MYAYISIGRVVTYMPISIDRFVACSHINIGMCSMDGVSIFRPSHVCIYPLAELWLLYIHTVQYIHWLSCSLYISIAELWLVYIDGRVVAGIYSWQSF